MAIDRVPHHLAREPADFGETFPAVELGHADRHFIAAALADLAPAGGEVRLAAATSKLGIGFHPPDQLAEIAVRQIQVEVQLAEIVEVLEVDLLKPEIKRLHNARTDRAVPAVRFGVDFDPVVPGGIFLKDLVRIVRRPVIDDDPKRRRHRLRNNAVQREPHIVLLVPARRYQHISHQAIQARNG